MLVEQFARLGAQHKAAVARHLTSLDWDSRLLRFGTPLKDEAISRYVSGIDFEHDVVEGVWDEGVLVGVAHLAVYVEDARPVGELGISVSQDLRHRHLGARLLSRVLLNARLMRLARVYVHYIVRNRPMARLARGFTQVVEIQRGEACATIDLQEVERAVA